MSKHTESLADWHPAPADFDRLRAGLLDGEPTVRDALEAHVRQCLVCQDRAAWWPRVMDALERDSAEERSTGELGARRQRALRGHPIPSRRVPIRFAVAAAVIVAAVGLGIFTFNERHGPATGAAATSEQAPDFYADIDFYLWLMEKQVSENAAPNG